jgi:RND superfamily putative drug exporter
VRETTKKGIFWNWGHFMYRYRYMVIALWLVVLIGFSFVAPKTTALLKDNGFTPKGSESELGINALLQELNLPESSVSIVYEADGLDLTSDEQKAIIMESLTPLKDSDFVESIAFENKSRNEAFEHVQAVTVSLKLSVDDALIEFPEIKKLVVAPEGMRAYVGGGTAVLYDMQVASKNDVVKAEIIGIPIALVILLFVFGTLIGAVLPLVIGLFSVTTTLGITYFIATEVPLSNFLPNVVTMLGLAVGIDYALFLVSRFREELRRQSSVSEAIAMTCQTAGQSIYFSGIAVLIGLLGTLFVDLSFFRTICLGGVLVVSISVLAANTLLLALLAVLGERINSLQVLPRKWRRSGPSPFWQKVAYGVMKRPVFIALIVGSALIVTMIPVGNMKLSVPSAEVLPPSYDSRYASDLLNQVYDTRELNPIQIRVKANQEVWNEQSILAIRNYIASIQQIDGVREVKSFLSSNEQATAKQLAEGFTLPQNRAPIEQLQLAKDRTALLVVLTEQDPLDISVNTLVHDLRKIQAPSELEVLVTGGPAFRVDLIDRIQGQIPEVLTFVMGVTFLILLFAFRSILLPLKAVLMNVLSLGASMGIVVLVFQYGYFADLLQITSIGYVSATIPVIIFCIVFGISMDYEVFLISRIAEEYDATQNNELSTATGLQKTGGLITSAAAILIAVVGSFVLTDIEIMKALGLGLGLAVLIDATIVRVLLVPALMKLLGKANWWAPAWIKRSTTKSTH